MKRATLPALLLALAAMTARADIAAITSQTAGALTLIDTDTATILSTTPLPGDPAAVAIDTGRNRILAIAVDTARLHVFDLSGQPIASFAVAGAPFGLAIDPATGAALITDQNGLLRQVDPATGRETANWQVGKLPSGVAIGDGVIVTADRDANTLTVVGGDRVRTVPVGRHPFGVTLHDGLIFSANVLDNSVSVIDVATLTPRATIATGERPYAIAFAQGLGFVSNQYDCSITVFDDTFTVIARIETGDYPEGIAATADGRQIVVANWFTDTVTLIDAQTLTVSAVIDVPAGPRAFGLFIGLP